MSRHYPRRPDDRRLAKPAAVLRRRILPALLMLLAVAAAYVALGAHEEVTYDAEVVLYVPPNSAGEQPPGNQDAAVKLAKTYAAALPLNQTLVGEAAQRSQEPTTYVGSHLTVTNDAGTSIVRIAYAGSSPAATTTVLGYLSRRLTANDPPRPVTPGSVKVVDLPKEAVTTGGRITQRVPLGLSMGLVAGLALAYVLETVRPRVDTVRELHRALGVPVTWWGRDASTRLWSWARQAAGPSTEDRPIELVPADRAARRAAWAVRDDAVQASDSVLTPDVSTHGHAPRPVGIVVAPLDADEAGDPLHAFTVLVARRGVLQARVQAAAELLSAQARHPVGAILTGSLRQAGPVPDWQREETAP